MNDITIIKVAKANNLEPAAVKSITIVESGGNGFISTGKPKILFEGHIFWNQLIKIDIDPNKLQKGNENILYPKWIKTYYSENQYLRLEKAKKIDIDAALKSTSWGLFQIMGFNYLSSGYNTVTDYVNDMMLNEEKQLQAFINFIKNDNNGNKYNALENKDWKLFAKLYNGSGYAQNKYDIKLENSYNENIDLNKQ